MRGRHFKKRKSQAKHKPEGIAMPGGQTSKSNAIDEKDQQQGSSNTHSGA